MTRDSVYQPRYGNTWALLVGIDEYKYVAPLGYAKSDAEGVARMLQARFGIEEKHTTLLCDGAASRDRIIGAFLKYAIDPAVGPDDRVIVFFAGHGHTVPGRRGEVGFLVPVDGRLNDLATLIRWDDLTRNADLIVAKHVLFLMDACYGGLALTRKPLPSGSMRFLKDMLQRYSRQVLTAGKANELVADSGGPRRGHSMFTGHLLDALDGAAATSEGVLTANGVMAYVYERVARDPHSQQTPHYGFLDGDGDLIFDTSALCSLEVGPTDEDLLVNVTPYTAPILNQGESVADVLKDLLAAQNQQIRLDDFISAQVRRFLHETTPERFPGQEPEPNRDEAIARVKRYERHSEDLKTSVTLLGRWADTHQLPLLEKVFARLGEADKASAGYVLWQALAWYPVFSLIYAAGIAALSAKRYDALRAVLLTRATTDSHSGETSKAVVIEVGAASGRMSQGFKLMPGREREYVPVSEYLFKELQPSLEDLLFLGRGYEALFDRFEMLLALTCADLSDRNWGPPGRFAWKHKNAFGGGPFRELLAEIERDGSAWPPVKAGLFHGSADRALKVARAYAARLEELNWY